jgi:hypothetical protein
MKILLALNFLILSIIGLSQNSTSKEDKIQKALNFFLSAKSFNCLTDLSLDYEKVYLTNIADRSYIKGPSHSMPGNEKRVYNDFTYEVINSTTGAILKKGSWACNQLSQNSNQNCNVIFQIPVLPFKYIDNRELCIYCRQRYIPYKKVDLNEMKNSMTVAFIFEQIDTHCNKVEADNNHKASHIEQITNLLVKKGYYKNPEDIASALVFHYETLKYLDGLSDMLNKVQSLLGGQTEKKSAQEFAIKLYDNNNTKFCTREHEDLYNRRY